MENRNQKEIIYEQKKSRILSTIIKYCYIPVLGNLNDRQIDKIFIEQLLIDQDDSSPKKQQGSIVNSTQEIPKIINKLIKDVLVDNRNITEREREKRKNENKREVEKDKDIEREREREEREESQTQIKEREKRKGQREKRQNSIKEREREKREKRK